MLVQPKSKRKEKVLEWPVFESSLASNHPNHIECPHLLAGFLWTVLSTPLYFGSIFREICCTNYRLFSRHPFWKCARKAFSLLREIVFMQLEVTFMWEYAAAFLYWSNLSQITRKKKTLSSVYFLTLRCTPCTLR